MSSDTSHPDGTLGALSHLREAEHHVEQAAEKASNPEAKHQLERALTVLGTARSAESASDGLRADGGRPEETPDWVTDPLIDPPEGEAPGESVQPDLPVLEFAEEHVDDIHAGRKTATVRYQSETAQDLSVGDLVVLRSETGTPIRIVEVSRTAACYAWEAFEVLCIFGAKYPAESASELVAGVNRHYDAPVRSLTDVRVVCWKEVSDDAE